MLSALLSWNLLPFLACLGKRNRDRLLAAFHLASLAAAAALGAAAFVAVHLAADFLPRAARIFSSALLSHLVSPLFERRWSEGIYRACDADSELPISTPRIRVAAFAS